MVTIAIFLLFLINVNIIGGKNIMLSRRTEQTIYEKEIDPKADVSSKNTIHATNSDKRNPTTQINSRKQMAAQLETLLQDGSAMQGIITQVDSQMHPRETDPRLGPIRRLDLSNLLRQSTRIRRRRTRTRSTTTSPMTAPSITPSISSVSSTALSTASTRRRRSRTTTTTPSISPAITSGSSTAATRRRRSTTTTTTITTPFTVKYLDEEATTRPWIWTTNEDTIQKFLAKKLPFRDPAPGQIGDLPKGQMFPVTEPLWRFEDYDDTRSKSELVKEDYQLCENQMVRCTRDTEYNQPVCVVDLTMNARDVPLYARSKGFHSQCAVEYRNCLKRYEITGKYYAESSQEDYLEFLHYGWCKTCKLFGETFCV